MNESGDSECSAVSVVCPSCGEQVEASNFCTECGTPLPRRTTATTPSAVHEVPASLGKKVPFTGVTAPPQAKRKTVGPLRSSWIPDKESGWRTAGKVIDGVGRVITTLVGLVWFLVGVVALIFSVPAGMFLGVLIGIGFIAYGIYLMKPGGWKLVIY
jgi:hypothetical protein